MDKSKRIEEINNLLLELASGNFNVRGIASDARDEMDAIIMGINMLGEELRASTVTRDYLQSIYRGVVDMLIILTPEGEIEKVNETVVSLLGYEENELIGTDFRKLIFQEDQQEYENKFNILFEEGHVYNLEQQLISKSGKKIPVSISSSLLITKEGKVNGIVNIAKDITHIQRTQKQLETRNKELQAFAYRAFHDLKGPLATMEGLVNITLGERDIKKVHQNLEMILNSTSRLNDILTELLNFTRSTINLQKEQKIYFKSLVQEVLNDLKLKPGFNEVRFEIQVQQESEFCNDRNQIRNILYHLVKNGFDFRDKDSGDSFIRVFVEVNESEALIIIEDNGIGIQENLFERIFDMFYRGSQQSSGMGLGLYLVKGALENLEGSIYTESKTNQGSRFEVHIPNLKPAL